MYSLQDLLSVMSEADASDLYVSVGAFPMLKISGEVYPIEKEQLTVENLESLKTEMLNEEQLAEYQTNKELRLYLKSCWSRAVQGELLPPAGYK